MATLVDRIVDLVNAITIHFSKYDVALRAPIYTYTGQNLTRIDYDNGTYQLLNWIDGRLASYEEHVLDAISFTTTYITYNSDGNIINETQVIT